jgi:hypothetical protein
LSAPTTSRLTIRAGLNSYEKVAPESQQHRRDDLVARCRAVRADGWDNYRYVWSTGEVVAVAYLLDSRDVLKEMSEDETTVLRRCSYDLWGIRGGEADETAGLTRTRKWFMQTRSPAVADAE